MWSSYWENTKPQAEKAAKRIEREAKQKADPMLDLVADTEGREQEARRESEALRELIALIRDA